MNKQEQTNYKREFNERVYDRIYITVPKGRKKDVETYLRDHPDKGQSINGLVNVMLREEIGMSNDEWRAISTD